MAISLGHIGSKNIFINSKVLGPKYGKETQTIIDSAKNSDFKFIDNEKVQLGKFIIKPNEYEVRFTSKDGKFADCDKELLVSIDPTITDNLKNEGDTREIVRHIQELRKKANYNVDDRIELYISENGLDIIDNLLEYVTKETLTSKIVPFMDDYDQESSIKIDDQDIVIRVKH